MLVFRIFFTAAYDKFLDLYTDYYIIKTRWCIMMHDWSYGIYKEFMKLGLLALCIIVAVCVNVFDDYYYHVPDFLLCLM